MNVLGLDIGGANIKASDADGQAVSVPFRMWTQKGDLTETLQRLADSHFSVPDMVALTMTAELADCFLTKEEGVAFIIAAVEQAFGSLPIRVWLTSGEFAEPADARDLPELVAAANWHALATWVGRAVPDGPALLIDVGSTTTDIIPLLDGFPIPEGRQDCDRLRSGELVYSGVSRTPVCAVVQSVLLHGRACPVAAEVFATIADAFVVMQLMTEDPACVETADGRPRTLCHSRNRLAHMVCCDSTELTDQDLITIAESVVNAQMSQLVAAAEQVLAGLAGTMANNDQRSIEVERPVLLVSGSGAFLGHRLAAALGTSRFSETMFLPDMFHRGIAASACAFAVARLAHDLCRDDLLETVDF